MLSGGFRGFSRFPRKPPFEIDFNLVGLNTLIEQSDRNAPVTKVLLEIIIMYMREGRKEYES